MIVFKNLWVGLLNPAWFGVCSGCNIFLVFRSGCILGYRATMDVALYGFVARTTQKGILAIDHATRVWTTTWQSLTIFWMHFC